ncbi:DUF4230 domain-containing protein [Aquiflexum gelatinilyticum]|jgi:hypothetical protein|uniref:DUF4230 domain-containing protein n=1 Tax=Aquiflexum gelatinilyticum TaxID=2961943 RepID=UPI002166D4AD|nr:DUF4230 domain-containing protein [Aquiflexum gelatinilyticum]MCS4436915.1 DUF4230 domain-containing protein [Aquiflexum gelatinilyticum]
MRTSETIFSRNSFLAVMILTVLLFSCKKNERALVVGKIQNASDLATTEFVIDKIVFGTKTKKLALLKISEASFMAYSKARVKAGIDLSKIKEADIRIEDTKIHLELPPIEVINFSYPPSSFVEDSLISDPKVFLNKIDIRDQEEFFRLAELDIRENLRYMGIVRTTQNNTRQLFQILLSSLGYDEIYISFKSDDLIISKVNLLVDTETIVEQ